MRNRTLTSKSIRKELRRVGPMANPSAAASTAHRRPRDADGIEGGEAKLWFPAPH